LRVDSLSNVKNIARSTFGYLPQARQAADGDLTKVIHRHHLSFHAVGASILGSCCVSQVNCGLISDGRT